MVTKNLLIRGGADFSSMQKSLKKVNKNLNHFRGVATKAFAAVTAAVAAIGIKKSLDAIDYQIMQETKLAVIMRQRMGATEQMIQSVKNLTSAQQSLGVIGDEVQLAGAQQLATFLRTSDALEALIPAMNNLAAQQKGVNATGEDLVGIANMIGKVLDGNVGALKRVGISFSDADQRMLEFGNEAERAATLARVIENNVGQMNSALANTSAGRVKQLSNSFGDMQEEIGRLIVPLRDVIVPLLQRMVSVATRAVISMQSAFSGLATFLHTLFGTTPPTQMATGAVQSAEAIGDAYEEAGEKAKGSLAGFDEINSLAQSSGAGASAPTVPEMATGGLFQGLGEKTSEVSQKMQEMAEKVKASWNTMREKIDENKELIIAALSGLAAGFASFLIMSNWALIVATITKGLAAIRLAIMGIAALVAGLSLPVLLIAAAVAALVAGFVYFYQTNETFRGVVDGILNAIADAAVWLWENVLVPLGKFLADVFVAAWDAIVTVAQFLWKNVFVPLGDFLLWFYDEVIKPLASILMDVLKIAFEAVSEIAQAFWKDVIVPLGAALNEMFGPAVEALSAVFEVLWKNVLVPLGTFLVDTLKKQWEEIITVIKTLWDTILKPFATYIKNTLVNTFKNSFSSIKDVINGLKDVFIGVMKFITGVFTGDMEKALNGLKQIFKGVFESLWGIVKFPLNQIIDGINTVIGGLNKISFKLPDWVPGVGGKDFGINIPQIPPLAQGGIVGANSPMLAMVGDNRTQKEAIAPVDDLMTMISSAVLAAMNAQGTRGDVVLNIDGVSFARVTNPYQAKEATRIGANMITVS
jgi:phage-related protein